MDDVVAQQNPQVPQTPQNKKSALYTVFKYVTIGTGIVGIGVLIALGGYLFATSQQKKSENIQVSPTPIVQATPTPVASAFPMASPSITSTQVAGQKLYTNPGFGISFLFASESNGEKYDVKEDGNKIYVYNTKYPYTQGQYLEVFQKSETDNLTSAIEKEFLKGISSTDCFVKKGNTDTMASYPSTFEVKTLGFPVDQNSDIPSFAQENKCPKGYAQTNGISYFLGDSVHPKIFIFLSIGQYAIPSAPNSDITWQDTIKFL